MNSSMSMPNAIAALPLTVMCMPAQSSPFEPTQLGPLPGDTDGFSYFLSDDGKTAVIGSYNPAINRTRLVVWTESTGLIPLDYPGLNYSQPEFLSQDGHVLAGTACAAAGGAPPCQSFIWTPSGGLQSLGFLSGDAYSRVSGPYPTEGQFLLALSCPSQPADFECRPFIWKAAT